MLRAPVWALCCCLAMADGLLGCDTSCDKENEAEPRLYEGGVRSPTCTSYQTNAFDQEYLDFPAGRRWAIRHGLGDLREKVWQVKSYVAFVEAGLPEGKVGNTAESAGNQVIIQSVDDEFVVVRNDTCEHFWLRLVVEVDVPDPDCLNPGQGAGGAGGAPGAAGAAGAGG